MRKGLTKAGLLSSCFFILTTIINPTFAQRISIAPSRLFFSGEAGQTVSMSITFTNTSSQDIFFVSSVKDWDRDSTGNKRYYPMGTLKDSNAQWLTLSEGTLHLPPMETKKVAVHLTIPPLAKEEQKLTHSMLFFTQMKEQKQRQFKRGSLGINVVMEVGIQIYHVPSGLKRGDLTFLAFEDRGYALNKADSVRHMALKVRNTGAINKDAVVRLELTNMATGKEVPLDPVPIAMLPEAEQWVALSLPGKLHGRFLVVAILDAGSQYDLKVAEKEITY